MHVEVVSIARRIQCSGSEASMDASPKSWGPLFGEGGSR
jgi:hypothetical protein